MEFLKARMDDIDQIMSIVTSAQRFMGEQGLTQWQDGYPDAEQMRSDIEKGVCHILRIGGRTAAIASIVLTGEPTYDKIYEGRWKGGERYAAIHRVAIGEQFRGMGISARLFEHALDYCKSEGFDCVRIDTHRDNKIMRGVIEKSGFAYCGIIYLENGDERLAYEINGLPNRQNKELKQLINRAPAGR